MSRRHSDPYAHLPTDFLVYWRERAYTVYKQHIATPKKTKGVWMAIEIGSRQIARLDRELRKREHA